MNKNLYTRFALSIVLCFFVFESFSSAHDELKNAQTTSTSFVSKPANNSFNVSAPTLKVTANVVTGATRYTIELNTNISFTGTSIIKTSTVDNQRTLIFSDLSYSTTYYARAMTNISGYGKISKFSTRAEIFSVVTQPLAGAYGVNPVVLLVNVSPVPDAKRYIVELNNKSDFSGSSILLSGSLNDQTSFIFKDLKYYATYYARVKSDISTAFGPAVKFMTRKKIPHKRLWGLSNTAGDYNNGTIFSFSVDSSTFSKHHDYVETNDYPNAYLDGSLTHAPDGGFYGNSECANNGTCANGEIFHVSQLGEYSLISRPYIHAGGVMLASNNQLYITDDWINYFQGGIIRIPSTPSPFELSQVIFRIKSKSQGQNPSAALIELPDGYLYGMAPYGGTVNQGVVYKIKLDGTGFTVIHNFNQSISGSYPQGHLLKGSDGFLYGTTLGGGQFNLGTVFKIFPDGSSFSSLFSFSGTNGSQPSGSLVEKNNKVYGLTPAGGDFNHGITFSINLDGSGFKKLFSFNGINGDAPVSTPTIVDTYIFGTTTFGGINQKGVIFKMKIDGTAFEKLHDFSANDGANPTGSLLLAEDFFPPATASLTATVVETNTKSATSYSVGIFPNPFMNDFTTEVSSDSESPVKIMITDLSGEILSEVSTTTNSTIPFGADLTKGIYILKVIKGNEVSSHRIVKK